MQPLPAFLQALPMQRRVDVARVEVFHTVARFPGAAKADGIGAAAKKARSVAHRERGCLIQKEQLGPASPRHHLAPPSPEFANACEPCWCGPALLQKRLGCGIMNDA